MDQKETCQEKGRNFMTLKDKGSVSWWQTNEYYFP